MEALKPLETLMEMPQEWKMPCQFMLVANLAGNLGYIVLKSILPFSLLLNT